jgi:hypothetical protein
MRSEAWSGSGCLGTERAAGRFALLSHAPDAAQLGRVDGSKLWPGAPPRVRLSAAMLRRADGVQLRDARSGRGSP